MSRLIVYLPTVCWVLLATGGLIYSRRSLRLWALQAQTLADPAVVLPAEWQREPMQMLAREHQTDERIRLAVQLIYLMIGVVALSPPLVLYLLNALGLQAFSKLPVASFSGWLVVTGLLLAEALLVYKAWRAEQLRKRFRAFLAKRETWHNGA